MSTAYAVPKLAWVRSWRSQDVSLYPDSDGQPMADNDQQLQTMLDVRFGLQRRYRDAPAYIGANLLIYFEEGDPSKSIAPDVFVALGVPAGRRRTYLIWLEGKAPDVVFEFASQRTWKADVSWKKGLYQGLGVSEYILFDPNGEYFQPILQGYRLVDGVYQPLESLTGEQGVLGISSAVLGLDLWAQTSEQPGLPFVLRMWDRSTSAWLPTPDGEADAHIEAEARAEKAEARAEAEAKARAETEARLRALEAEIKRLRGEA